MKLAIGLGNPGEKYKGNRHNVGFMVINTLVEKLRFKGDRLHQEWKKSTNGKLQYIWFEIEGEKLELVKPQIFMNKSGISVAYAYNNHSNLKHNDIYIIHDDLDLRLGNYKIQKGKGPREHNGLLSIYENLGTKEFWHVRVGIDNRDSERRIDGERYVLQDITNKELAVIDQVIAKIVKELLARLI